MALHLGMDLGGTRLKAAAFDKEGRILARHTEPLTEPGSAPAQARTAREKLEKECAAPAVSIGLAAPGMAAADGSHIACLPGGKVGIEGFDWGTFFGDVPVIRVLNDAHAALLGEAWQGAARGLQEAVLVTLGTGVGGAILSGGRLLRGHLGRAGHLGHLCLDPDGTPGICGMPGSLEDYIGEQTVETRSGGRFSSTEELVAAAAEGDLEARRTWERSVYILACGLASVVNLLDPEALIIGGGIAGAGERLLGPLRHALDEVEWRPTGERVRLLTAELGSWAGCYGAARACLNVAGCAKPVP